jgi:hypothetical protein
MRPALEQRVECEVTRALIAVKSLAARVSHQTRGRVGEFLAIEPPNAKQAFSSFSALYGQSPTA